MHLLLGFLIPFDTIVFDELTSNADPVEYEGFGVEILIKFMLLVKPLVLIVVDTVVVGGDTDADGASDETTFVDGLVVVRVFK